MESESNTNEIKCKEELGECLKGELQKELQKEKYGYKNFSWRWEIVSLWALHTSVTCWEVCFRYVSSSKPSTSLILAVQCYRALASWANTHH